MTSCLLLALFSLLGGNALAQDPGANAPVTLDLRGPALGEVRQRDGGPWVGAEVVLVSRPLPENGNVGEPDRIVATTDARGRFRAEILRGRPYSVFASGEVNAAGRRATAVAERVFVQRPVVLRECRSLPERRVVLAGLSHWTSCTGFELRIVDHTDNRQVAWLDVIDGKATLPLLVGPTAFVEVFGKMAEGRVPLARQQIGANDPAREVVIELPGSRTVICWVRDTGGRPCAGATVFRRLGGMLHPAGATDAGGKLSLPIVDIVAPAPEFSTLVFADNCLAGICQRVGSAAAGDDVPAGAAPDDLFANVASGASLHARVLGLDGQPLVGLEVWCAGTASHRPARSSAMFDSWTRSVATDARGAFVLRGLHALSRATAHLLLRESDYASLPKHWRSGLSPIVFAPLVGQPGSGTVADPIVVDLRRMCPIELTLTEAGGAPAEDVELSFVNLTHDTYSPWSWERSELRADQRGRLRILVPGGERLGFRAVRGMAMLIRGFETSAACVDAGPAVARFELPAPTGIRGQLLEKSGAPGSGRTVNAYFGTDNAPAEWTYASQDARVLGDKHRNNLRVLLPEANQERLRLTVLISRPVITDDEGNFALPLTTDPLPGLLLFTDKVGVRSGINESKPVRWTGERQDDVAWQLRF